MTIEYILLLIASFLVGLKLFVTAPKEAFQKSGPRLAARVERHLATGEKFKQTQTGVIGWQGQIR